MVNTKSLEVWESEFRPQVAEVDLLGEIILTPDECRDLGQAFGQLVHRKGWYSSYALIRDCYLAAFAVFMVAQGKQGYDAGAFWPGMREATSLELSGIQTTDWGQLFEEAVERLGVARFPNLGGHRYVGPILAHGGIPLNNLAEFFEQFLLPSIENPRYAALTTTDYIEERLQHSSARYILSEPVLRFLQHGGSIAEDFFERCRQMTFQIAAEGRTPTAQTAGLPQMIVARFCEWLDTRTQFLPQRRGRFRKPRMILDPWGWGPQLQLPRQDIAAQDASAAVYWHIFAGDVLLGEVEPEVRRMEFHWHTTEEVFPLTTKAAEYRVELCIGMAEGNEEVRQSWNFPVFQDNLPLLAFDRETGVLIPVTHSTLPAKHLWLLYPDTAELTGEPTSSFQYDEELPSLSWDWATFKGYSVDLEHTRRLILQQGTDRRTINLDTAHQRGQPLLEGETHFPTADGRAPLFVAHPPRVRIPLQEHNRQLQRWRVTLRNEWAAVPEVDFVATLEELAGSLIETEEGVRLSLEATLPPGSMGNYRVQVRGPLGYAAELPFRLLPALEMVNHDTLHWPDDLEEPHLLMEVPASIVIEPQPGAQGCTIALLETDMQKAFYEVHTDVQKRDAPLRFVLSRGTQEPVIVPLTVPVLRLRWLIALAPEQALSKEWRFTSTALPLEALEQSLEPLLFVDLFGGAAPDIEAELQLLDDTDTVLQVEHARFRRGQLNARFDLRAFRDTLRNATTPLCRVILRLFDRTAPDMMHRFPVLSVGREFMVQDADAVLQPQGDTVILRLCWDAPLRLRRRFVRLWPLWRPWDPPLELDIPDSAEDECVINPPGDFLYGHYRMEFGVRDPWVPEPPPELPAPLEDAGTATALLPRDAVFLRRRQLDSGQNFCERLERALLFRFSGDHEQARTDFDWCVQHLDAGTLPQILTLAEALDVEPGLAVGLRIKMARLAHVRRAWEEGRDDEAGHPLFWRYIGLPPKYPVDTCEFLLTLNDSTWRLRALRELLVYGTASGVQAVAGWLQAGQLAEDDAIGMLEFFLNSGDDDQIMARGALLSHEMEIDQNHPAVLRVIENLGRRHPGLVSASVVRPGDWIHTTAGWGRIEEIQTATGEILPSLRTNTLCGRLLVVLRAQIPNRVERVIVDLTASSVDFVGATELYTCTKCRCFSTQHVANLHEHNRLTHDPGLGAAFSLQPSGCLKFHLPPSFAYAPPSNPWE